MRSWEIVQFGEIAKEYIARKRGEKNVKGHFDNAHRFYPDQEFSCCSSIRQPSRAFPFSLLKHSKTLIHVANEVHYSKTGFEFDKENLSYLRTMIKALENRSTE